MCNDKIDAATVYAVTNRMEMYSEQSRWSRFNTFLVVESIILVSWVELFSSLERNELAILLPILPLVGMLLGFVWAMLGSRSSKYQKKMHDAAMELEKNCIKGSFCIKPYHLIAEIEEEARKGAWYKKSSRSTLIVTYVPALFSLVFFIGLVWLYRIYILKVVRYWFSM